jgi:chemotaxis protein histidine kinase CheA
MLSNQEVEKEKEEKKQKREEQEKEKQQKDKKEEKQNKEKEEEKEKQKEKQEENKEKQEENKEKLEENKEKQGENKEKQGENKENQGENKEKQGENKEKQEEKLDEQKGKPEEKEKEEKLKPSNITKAEPSNDGQDKEKLNNDKKSDILKTKPSKEEQDKEKPNDDKKSDILKTQPSNNEQDKGKINNEQKSDILIRDTITRKSNSLSKKKNLLPITPSAPQPLDKNDMFDYFKLGICDRDPQRRSTEKLLLLFDEFKKIFFVKYNRNNIKPNISDFDLKLYPQMNVRNMKEILEFKKFMKSKFSEYIKIFMGTLLSVVVVESKEKIDDNTLFLGYLCATNTVKKLAEIQKYNLPLPKEKEFFYPSINKNEVEKIISRANQRKKEKSFILDGNSKNPNVIKPYNPLLDKNLHSFFNSQNNKNFLKVNGFIKQNGEINYDPIYRETLGFSKFGKDDKDVNKSFQTTNKFLVGYKRQSKGYSIYNENKSSAVVLPPIEQNKRKAAEEKNGNTINEEENESGSGSGGSGSGSGSGSGDDTNYLYNGEAEPENFNMPSGAAMQPLFTGKYGMDFKGGGGEFIRVATSKTAIDFTNISTLKFAGLHYDGFDVMHGSFIESVDVSSITGSKYLSVGYRTTNQNNSAVYAITDTAEVTSSDTVALKTKTGATNVSMFTQIIAE